MAWYTGKTKLVCASIGDSNALGSGGFTPPGGQSTNLKLQCYASATGQVPYSEANLGWRVLDPNGANRVAEIQSSATVGDLTYIGQALGGNGNSAMQMCDVLQKGTGEDPDVYLYQAASGGTTANTWANLGGWSTLARTIPTALAAIPGSPTYFDVIFFSLGTNDIIQTFTAKQYYDNYAILRGKMISAGWWIPGVTQVVFMDLPRGAFMQSVGYPGWKGIEYATTRKNDKVGIASTLGTELEMSFPVHFLPPSQTLIGTRAGNLLLAEPSSPKAELVCNARLLFNGLRLRVHKAFN